MILILSPWFYPLTHPRAHRWTALARYAAARGEKVHVVCARHEGQPEEMAEGNLTVHRVGHASLYALLGLNRRESTRVGAPSLPVRLAEGLYRKVWLNLCFPDDAVVWQPAALRKAEMLIAKHRPHLLISVSLPFSSHVVALQLKKRHPHLRWLADVGDPYAVQQPPVSHPALYGARARRLEKHVLETADAVVVTTPATVALFRETYVDAAVSKMKVAPPLLDPPWNEQSTAPVSDGVLRLGYFGAFYRGLRTHEPLLALYAALEQLGRPFALHVYGGLPPGGWPNLTARPHLHIHGMAPREAVRKAMASMHVLVNLGNATPWQLPSKAAEYYASGKPVLHVAQTPNDAFERFFGGTPRLHVWHYRQGRVVGDLPDSFVPETNVDAAFLETPAVWQYYQNG